MKNIFILTIVILFCNYSFSQIRVNNTSFSTSPAGFAFIDGANSSTYAGVDFAGKGVLFPRTDLTAITGSRVVFGTNGYDGTIVYNVGTGAIPETGMGTSNDDVYPGFYYYSNSAGTDIDAGVWIPMGIGNAPVELTGNTNPPTLGVTSNVGAENVISLTGSADGVSTHIDLGTTILEANTVKQLRKAIVYDASGNLVFVATGSYDVATNKFVTGNGIMNVVLPAADYEVELYYSAN
ncbi:MAG: hypothetical protein ABF257_06305 [Polaribacter sp.]